MDSRLVTERELFWVGGTDQGAMFPLGNFRGNRTLLWLVRGDAKKRDEGSYPHGYEFMNFG